MAQTADEKYDLITRRLPEVLGADIIKGVLAQEGRQLKGYWGTAPTGRPHIGYFVPLTKIADFLRAGVHMTVLLADVHAFLDNLKAPLELVAHRTKYYEYLLTAVFQSLGIPTSDLLFVQGSTYQLSREYNMDNYRLCATVTERDAKKAGAEVVKQVESPLLSGLLYPGLQALDEQYLGVDFQFGGVDQRKIFTFAEEQLPRLGYTKRAHLMNAMVPGLSGGKMSSSDPNSKIDFLDSPESIRKKVKSAFCEEGNEEGNGVLAFVDAVLIPIARLKMERGDQDRLFVGEGAPEKALFSIVRDEKFGGSLHYETFEAVRVDFVEKRLHPKDLKGAVADGIVKLLAPIRKAFEENEEWQKVENLAYPDPNKEKEKNKKKKKEKVYHPPPPDKVKAKNAKKEETAADKPEEAAPVAEAAVPS